MIIVSRATAEFRHHHHHHHHHLLLLLLLLLIIIIIIIIINIIIITYLLTYLLTPWTRVLLEKLTGSAASQEIPRIFGTRRFIAVLTSARHLSLSSANSIQSSQC